MVSRKAENGKLNAVLPGAFSSLGATLDPFVDKVCGHRAARDVRPSSLTQV